MNGKKLTKAKAVIISLIATVVIGFGYFYLNLPAINLQSEEFYGYIFMLIAVYVISMMLLSGVLMMKDPRGYFLFVKSNCKIPAIILAVFVLINIGGAIISAEIFRANDYHNLLTVETGDFANDVDEISYDKIPMVDEQSAVQLGNRKLGELSDMVSQFSVSGNYTQINFDSTPVRVTYLEYGDFFKWLGNRSDGIPAYMYVDMTTQDVDVVRLEDGYMKYSPSELFGRNIYRHLRFQYPTMMFNAIHFEIDEDKTPYWIAPTVEKTIGLFGGVDISGAVLVNAITGESIHYAIEDVPSWVDRVFSADLIMQQYNYHGRYVNGFLNSIFGQQEVTVTTEGHNYIALNDDIYVYTGVTSVMADQSNIGFILTNQRTKETHFYEAAGATEVSAQSSAEGVVQHLRYLATFPLLLNVDGQPTYFMALKDNSQLVKMYAMVNVEQYQIVATGTTVEECEMEYLRLLQQNNLSSGDSGEDQPQPTTQDVEGVIDDLRSAVIEGNTYYFVSLENSDVYFSLVASFESEAIVADIGDTVKITASSFEDDQKSVMAQSLMIVEKAPEPIETAPDVEPETQSIDNE